VIAALALVLVLGTAGNDTGILVSAASSLRGVIDEIVEAYLQRDPGAEVAINTAASGVLLRQIEHGAPVDLFLSASTHEIDLLEAEGRVRTSRVFAVNRLVVVVPGGHAPPTSIQELPAERFERIAIGNPGTVPAGRYARECFERLGLLDAIEPRLVLGENVRQVLEWAVRGEVDAALVYATDAGLVADRVVMGPLAPPRSHPGIFYEGAVIEGSRDPDLAVRLLEFLSSRAGKDILLRRGFLIPPEDEIVVPSP
jgi:molybdate transport system substrate-binding protein